MSAMVVRWRPWRASTRVAATRRSSRVRWRLRSNRVAGTACAEACLITESLFSYLRRPALVNSPRARPGDGDERGAARDVEHGGEVVLGPRRVHPVAAAPDAHHLPAGEVAHQVEAVDARVEEDAAAADGRVVEPGQPRRLEALVQD